MNEYKSLPKSLLEKASVWPDGEPGWKMEDIPDVIEAARKAGLACLGGQPQFRGPIGTAEPYWLNYDPEKRKPGESWTGYVDRTAQETLEAFKQMCDETDFLSVAKKWNHINEKMINPSFNPLEHLWFLLYFEQNKS